MQMAGKNINKVSFIVSEPNRSGKSDGFNYRIGRITNEYPEATISSLIKGRWGLIPFTQGTDFHNYFQK